MSEDHRAERITPAPPRLLDRLRAAIQARHYSQRTEETYVFWARKFIVFHSKRHPDTMGKPEVNAFVTHLAVSRKVAPAAQNQALAALVFLYRHVLDRDLGKMGDLIRAKRTIRIPVVLSPDEITRLLQHLRGPSFLAVSLMYGSGLRLLECLQLRVQDIDFARDEINVRQGKGRKDRRTLLPAGLSDLIRAQLRVLQSEHEEQRKRGLGAAFLPDTIGTRQPQAATEWAWQWLFPASRFHVSVDGARRRHHLHETVVQRASAIRLPHTCCSIPMTFARSSNYWVTRASRRP